MKKLFLDNRIMTLLVIINTVIIFIEGFEPDTAVFSYLDDLFTLLFLVEAVVKISTYSFRGYWADKWNRFDFVIVLLALPSLYNIISPGTIPTNIVLVFRIFRIFKAFRLMKAIPNFDSLVHGIVLATRSSLFVCVAFAAFILVFAVLSTALFGKLAPELFGHPGISLYSIFRLFTTDGWAELPETIALHSTPAMAVLVRILFSVLVFVGGILGMSLINSIFVDAMAEDNNDDLKQEIADLKAQLDRIEHHLDNNQPQQ